jgi:3-deoxy-D-manno-octulosonic acid (KDO) 8-phosphate synthase
MTITLVNPMNEAATTPRPAAPRLATLAGKTIGLLDISKPGGSIFLDRLEHLLVTQHHAGKVVRIKKPTFAKPAPQSVMDQIREEGCQAVIEALAD